VLTALECEQPDRCRFRALVSFGEPGLLAGTDCPVLELNAGVSC
jgi:hypothetical protein